MTDDQFEELMTAIKAQTTLQAAGFKTCAGILNAILANLNHSNPCGTLDKEGFMRGVNVFVEAIQQESKAYFPKKD